MNRLLTAAALSTNLWLVAACSVQNMEESPSEELGQTSEALCSNPDGVPQLQAALAVATARELGRLEARKDFVVSASTLQLSQAGRDRCTARGGCKNVDTLLAYQKPEAVEAKINPWKFASALVDGWQKQNNTETYVSSFTAEDHALTFETVNDGLCGLDYWFQAVKPSCATGGGNVRLAVSQRAVDTANHTTQVNLVVKLRNDGIDTVNLANTKLRYYFTADGASNWMAVCYYAAMGCDKLTSKVVHGSSGSYVEYGFSSGYVNSGRDTNEIQLGLRRSDWSTINKTNDFSWVGYTVAVEEASYRDVSNMALTYNGALVGGSSPGYDSLPNYDPAKNTSCKLDNPANLKNKLTFVGGDQNEFLQFDSTASMIKIDPTGTLVGGGTTTSAGSCVSACSVYDPTRTSTGACCVCNGTYGTLRQSAFSPNSYVCR